MRIGDCGMKKDVGYGTWDVGLMFDAVRSLSFFGFAFCLFIFDLICLGFSSYSDRFLRLSA